MDSAVQFVQDNGGWGAWFLTVAWVVWMVSTDRFMTPGRKRDLENRLASETEDKEFWREAATLSTEIGSLLSKAKVAGRRSTDAQQEE